MPRYLDYPSTVSAYVPTEHRTVYLQPLGRRDYGVGQESVFSIPNNGFLDTMNSTISLEIESTVANIRRFLFDEYAGFSQLIRKISVYSPSGALIQECDQYHVYTAVRNAMLSKSEYDSKQSIQGLNFDTGIISDSNTTLEAALGKKLVINFPIHSILGPRGPTKLFPCTALGGEMRIHIFWNNLSAAFVQTGLTSSTTTYNNVHMRLIYTNLPSEEQQMVVSKPISMLYENYAHQQTKTTLGANGVTTSLNFVLRQPFQRAKFLFVTHRFATENPLKNSCRFDLPPNFKLSIEVAGRRMPEVPISSEQELLLEFLRCSDGHLSTLDDSEIDISLNDTALVAYNAGSGTKAGLVTTYSPKKVIFGYDLRKFCTEYMNNKSNGSDIAMKEFQLIAEYTANSSYATKAMTVDTFLVYESEMRINSGVMDILR